MTWRTIVGGTLLFVAIAIGFALVWGYNWVTDDGQGKQAKALQPSQMG